MSLCPHCQGENREDAERCVHCGLPLPLAGHAPDTRPSEADALGGDSTNEADTLDDPLAGLEGLLPPVTLPPMPEIAPDLYLEPTDEELRAAEVLHRLATAPPSLGPPRQRAASALPPSPSGRGRLLLSLLVVLAVLLPLVSRGRLDASVAPLPDAAAFQQALDALQPGERAVLVFDYAASASAELAPLIERALDRLAARGVRIIALSSRPEGVDLARRALESLSGRKAGMRDGTDLALLGYLAGDSAGLRLASSQLDAAFAGVDAAGRPLRDLPILQGLNGLNDAEVLVVLSDDAHVARRWIEQVGAWTEAPLLMATTAASEPMLRPYATSGQVTALLSGAYGAIAQRSAASLNSADGFLAFGLVLAAALAAGWLSAPRLGREGRR